MTEILLILRNWVIEHTVFMNTRMGRKSALGDAIRPGIRCSVGIDLLQTVRLIVVLAVAALEARVYLSPNTDPLADLGERHGGAHPDHFANDLVADGKRVGHLTPVASNGMYITGAYAAALDLNVEIIVANRT